MVLRAFADLANDLGFRSLEVIKLKQCEKPRPLFTAASSVSHYYLCNRPTEYHVVNLLMLRPQYLAGTILYVPANGIDPLTACI